MKISRQFCIRPLFRHPPERFNLLGQLLLTAGDREGKLSFCPV